MNATPVTHITADIDRTIWTLITAEREKIAPLIPHLDANDFTGEAKHVAHWVIQWLKDHKTTPGFSEIAHRADTFRGEVEGTDKVKRADRIEDYLRHLVDNYDGRPLNHDRSITVAMETINGRRLQKVLDRAEQLREAGNIALAAKTVEDYQRVGIIRPEWLNPNDRSSWDFLQEKSDPLFTFSGDLGKFFGDTLKRRRLISLMGPEKRGKSFWLLEFAMQAFKQGLRVAFVSVGDMDEQDMMERWGSMLTGLPLEDSTVQIPGGIEVTVGKSGEQSHPVAVANVRKRGFTVSDVRKAQKKIEKSHGVKNPRDSLTRFYTYPMHSMSASGISEMLSSESHGGWDVDVVVIDYADILEMPSGKDEREQINKTWMELRKMSQVLDACVITATQSDAQSYSAETLGMQHFTNDKRKLSHVFGMVGLNQTADEKQDDVMRLNWIVRRKGRADTEKCVHVAACRGISHIAMHSKL